MATFRAVNHLEEKAGDHFDVSLEGLTGPLQALEKIASLLEKGVVMPAAMVTVDLEKTVLGRIDTLEQNLATSCRADLAPMIAQLCSAINNIPVTHVEAPKAPETKVEVIYQPRQGWCPFTVALVAIMGCHLALEVLRLLHAF